jgi:hypothetical protein
MAPLSEWAHMKMSERSKRGSPMPGIAISIWPSRKSDFFIGSTASIHWVKGNAILGIRKAHFLT